jgi:hypothetical protein
VETQSCEIQIRARTATEERDDYHRGVGSDGVTVSATRVLADGTSLTGGFSAHYDGKDYSVAGLPDIETIAYNRVDANTLAFTLKHGEVVVGTGNAVVSNNGTMRTTTVTATNVKGQRENDVRVYDKQ